jgi:hypothetical protein
MSIRQVKTKSLAYIEGRPTKTMVLKIEGSGEAFDTLVNLLAAIQWAGSAGHSGKFGCFIDGDGADKIRIEGLPPNDGSKMAQATCEYGGDYEMFHANGAWCESGVRTEEVPTGVKVTKVWPSEESM